MQNQQLRSVIPGPTTDTNNPVEDSNVDWHGRVVGERTEGTKCVRTWGWFGDVEVA